MTVSHQKSSHFPLWQKYLIYFPWALRTELAKWSQHASDLIAIESNCFSPHMRSTDSDLKDLVKDPESIVMLVYWREKAIGYISGVPLESPSSSFDPDSDPLNGYGDNDTLYIDSIAILEEYRSPAALQFMLVEFTALGLGYNYKFVTAHVRQSNGLAVFLMRVYGFKMLKKIDNWYDCKEIFVYMRVKTNNMEFLGRCWLRCFNVFRVRFYGTWVESVSLWVAKKLS